jgi:hypothetical protein
MVEKRVVVVVVMGSDVQISILQLMQTLLLDSEFTVAV